VKRRRRDRSRAGDSEDEDESEKGDISTTVKRVKADTEKKVTESAKAERKRTATEQFDETTEDSEDEEEKEPAKATAKRISKFAVKFVKIISCLDIMYVLGRTKGDDESSDVDEEGSDAESDDEEDDVECSVEDHSDALVTPTTSFHSCQNHVDGFVIGDKPANVCTERPDLATLRANPIDEKEDLAEHDSAPSLPKSPQIEHRPKIGSLADLAADQLKHKQRGEDLLQAFDEDSSADSKLKGRKPVISTTS
jgi:hypothetical protein